MSLTYLFVRNDLARAQKALQKPDLTPQEQKYWAHVRDHVRDHAREQLKVSHHV